MDFNPVNYTLQSSSTLWSPTIECIDLLLSKVWYPEYTL